MNAIPFGTFEHVLQASKGVEWKRLLPRVREIEQEPPDRNHRDGAVADLHALAFGPRDDGRGCQAEFGHRVAQRRHFPFPRLRFDQRLAHLYQRPRTSARLKDKVHLPPSLRPVVENLRAGSAQSHKDQILQKMARN